MIAIKALLGAVPAWLYVALLALLLMAGGGWWTYSQGKAHTQALWDADKARAVAHVGEAKQEQAQIETRVVTEYVDRVKTIYKQGATITKEIPVYVTKIDDSRCTINNGFVSVWNSANTGVQLPGTPSSADAAPSGVVLSDVATQHATESQYTRELEAQLEGLQDWVEGVSSVK